MRRRSSGFQNDAADKIWNDHLGNNAFTHHRDQCAICQARYRARRGQMCPEGERIFDEMLDDLDARIDEALLNQN